MTVIAIAGDCTTTTALAIAAGWPAHADGPPPQRADEMIIVEADPRGGSLSAWLDSPASPSLSTVVTALHQTGPHDGRQPNHTFHWATVDPLIQQSVAGPRFIPAPIRSREARTAVHEASHGLLPMLAGIDHTVALVDTGPVDLVNPAHAFRFAEVIVLCHRQASASAPAAAARLERLAEHVEALTLSGHRTLIALIGDQPFAESEVVPFVAPDATSWTLPVDQLAAAVLGGRRGVSTRRLARLPLMRAAETMARDLSELVGLSHTSAATSLPSRAEP